jgi:hypothetical protein
MAGVIPSLASVAPVGADLLSARQPLGSFVFITRLQFSLAESHGLAWGFGGFLFSPKSCSLSSKSQDFWSGLVAPIIEVESCGVLPAVSRRAGSKVRPGWRPEPACCLLGTCAALGLVPTRRPAQHASGQSCHFDFGITTVITSRVIMLLLRWLAYVSDVSRQLLPRSATATAAVAHDAGVVSETPGGYPSAALL